MRKTHRAAAIETPFATATGQKSGFRDGTRYWLLYSLKGEPVRAVLAADLGRVLATTGA